MLDDNDPLWERHSGGNKHRGVEWEDGDGVLAEAFYAALPESTRFIFDLMMDNPGERLNSDWIAAQIEATDLQEMHCHARWPICLLSGV